MFLAMSRCCRASFWTAKGPVEMICSAVVSGATVLGDCASTVAMSVTALATCWGVLWVKLLRALATLGISWGWLF